MQTTPLGYALIGLAIAMPSSGYAFRKVFETTPLGAFSSSPGSIYPALGKLTKAGFLKQRPDTNPHKPVYHATQAGRAALSVWVLAPVSVEEVANEIDIALLRFAFLESVNDPKATLRFLATFIGSVETHLEQLTHYLGSEAAAALSPYGRLAMQSGIAGYEAQRAWAVGAQQVFENEHQRDGAK